MTVYTQYLYVQALNPGNVQSSLLFALSKVCVDSIGSNVDIRDTYLRYNICVVCTFNPLSGRRLICVHIYMFVRMYTFNIVSNVAGSCLCNTNENSDM